MDPKDITFMKSGFNNLVEEDEVIENTGSVVMVFMQNAMKNAGMRLKCNTAPARPKGKA